MPKKKARKQNGKKQSASDFIRSQPASLSGVEVVAAGKKKGLKFTPGLVYIVRGRTRPKKAKAKARKTSPKLTGRTLAARAASENTETEFRRIVLELGVARSQALVRQVGEGLERLARGER